MTPAGLASKVAYRKFYMHDPIEGTTVKGLRASRASWPELCRKIYGKRFRSKAGATITAFRLDDGIQGAMVTYRKTVYAIGQTASPRQLHALLELPGQSCAERFTEIA